MKTILILLAILITSCGSPEQSSPPAPIETPSPMKKVNLFLFGAPPCEACNREIPEIYRRLDELGGNKSKVHVRVYVVAGPQWTKATVQNAKQYGIDLGVPFEMIPDFYCVNVYARFFPDEVSCRVPAAVIVDSEWNVIKNFPPGQLSPVEGIMKTLKGINGK